MKPLILALLLAPLAALSQSEAKPVLSFWKEDFSDPSTLSRHWSSYGFLASGIDAKNPLGKPVSGKESRPEWWQVVDGTLRGQNFPEEKHGSGIGRNFSGRDVRLRLRFKIPPGGMAAVSIRGQNPIVERNFALASLHIRADGVAAGENDVLHPKGSPEAEELKKKGVWNRRYFYAKTVKTGIAPDVWHELDMEMRGKELSVSVDGKHVLRYTTLSGDAPKTSVGLGAGGNGKTILATWYDDVSIEPLEAKK